MYSSNKINTIIKYILLIIMGLFVIAVLNGARQVEEISRNIPENEENIATIKLIHDGKDGSFTYNEMYPLFYLEFVE
jgi:hypothetical protein